VTFPLRTGLSFCVVAIAVGIIGCQREDTITAYQAPKEERPSQMRRDESASQPQPQQAHDEIQWTVPEGWAPLPAGDMRYAAFAVSKDDPSLVVTVIPLGPNLPMLANINRWENQIGVPPSGEGDLSKLLKPMDVNGQTAQLIELAGIEAPGKPKQMILAAIFERPDRTWYLKLQGDAAKVAAQREKFDTFVKSVRFPDTQGNANAKTQAAAPPPPPPPAPAPAPQAVSANPNPGGPRWTVPAGWELQPERPMRIATFKAPGSAEVIVSSFGAEALKDKLGNINRWRGMVELPPIDDPSTQAVEKTTAGALPASLYQFENAGKKLAVVTIDRGQTIVFVRFSGPAAAVDAQKANFDSFLQSFQW